MKKVIYVFAAALAALFFVGCNRNHVVIAPLPSGYEAESLTDCTVPAEFSSCDFNWMGGNLTMTVYSEDIYDAVAVRMMRKGDTLVFGGERIVVEKVVDNEGFVVVNDGVDNGGAWLQASEGGTYRATTFDDHSLYSRLGSAHLPLAEDFIIVDCGTDPYDPSDTVSTDQKLYLETLEDWRQSFSPLDTRVVIENGLITNITRVWIP